MVRKDILGWTLDGRNKTMELEEETPQEDEADSKLQVVRRGILQKGRNRSVTTDAVDVHG